MSKYVDGIEFVTEECCSCGIPFAMTKDFQKRRLDDRKNFYCPSGHEQHYVGKTEAQKLREKLEIEQRRAANERAKSAELRRQRDQLGKSYGMMRERVKNGVCPCCNRTFQNLLNHMKTKHPDFGSSELLRSIRSAYGLTQQALADEVGVSNSYISLYENEHDVPEYVRETLEKWVHLNAASERS